MTDQEKTREQSIAEYTIRYAGAYLMQQAERDKLMRRTKIELVRMAVHIGLDIELKVIKRMSKARLVDYLVDFIVNIQDLEERLEEYGVDFDEFKGFLSLPGVTYRPIYSK